MRNIIFIPARGGSKSIPGKNMVDLNGRPLIQYTLDTAKELQADSDFEWFPFISTDDENIAAYCETQGFDMSYRRPMALSGDTSIVMDAVWDALNWLLRVKGLTTDSVLLLQPTSPRRRVNDIIRAANEVRGETEFSIVSVTRMREHPCECIEVKRDDWGFLRKAPINTRRQDYESNYYFIDGSFYYASLDFLRKNKTFVIENKTRFQTLDQYWPIDIDNNEDLLVAATLLADHGTNQ